MRVCGCVRVRACVLYLNVLLLNIHEVTTEKDLIRPCDWIPMRIYRRYVARYVNLSGARNNVEVTLRTIQLLTSGIEE